jgi:NhaP-type Na+/H+ or K+/H+ antiporter
MQSLAGKSQATPTLSQGIVVSWCGMRGLVTLAVALALPKQFPGHALIILSAFSVVIGTLIIQGLTLKPLIEFLRFPTDHSMENDLSETRADLIDLAIAQLGRRTDEATIWVIKAFEKERQLSFAGSIPQDVGAEHRLRRTSIASMRDALLDLRRAGTISDDTFHALEQEFDLAELAVTPPYKF